MDRSDEEEVLHLQAEEEGRERENGEDELKDMVEGCKQGGEGENNIFTRLTKKGLFYPPQVWKIQELVRYGLLPEDKLQRLKSIVSKFADMFTLSVREVKPVDFIKFWVDIPEDAVFPLKVNQQPLTQAQKEFYLPLLDKFEAAGILRPIRSDDVRAVHLTVLAQKAHGAPGLTMDKIQWMVEDQCREVGMEPNQDLPPRPPQESQGTATDGKKGEKPKWRVCQNFNEVNKVTRVALMLQGDIRAKQQ